MTSILRLSLSNVRSYADAVLDAGSRLVVLTGDNGAGKTMCWRRFRCSPLAEAFVEPPWATWRGAAEAAASP
jgi:predicted ATPase